MITPAASALHEIPAQLPCQSEQKLVHVAQLMILSKAAALLLLQRWDSGPLMKRLCWVHSR